MTCTARSVSAAPMLPSCARGTCGGEGEAAGQRRRRAGPSTRTCTRACACGEREWRSPGALRVRPARCGREAASLAWVRAAQQAGVRLVDAVDQAAAGSISAGCRALCGRELRAARGGHGVVGLLAARGRTWSTLSLWAARQRRGASGASGIWRHGVFVQTSWEVPRRWSLPLESHETVTKGVGKTRPE